MVKVWWEWCKWVVGVWWMGDGENGVGDGMMNWVDTNHPSHLLLEDIFKLGARLADVCFVFVPHLPQGLSHLVLKVPPLVQGIRLDREASLLCH